MDPVIEEIRRRADIVEVIGEYVSLIPAGAERYKACCPFHNEKTPSFNVSRDKGFFKCFGCSVSGDVFKFVSLIENLPFGEVKRKLAERYGVPLRDRADLSPEQEASYAERDRLLRVTSAAAAWFREQFAGNAGLQARDYARSRKLKRETLEAFGIGYAPDSWDSCTNFLTRKFGFSAEDGAAAGLLVEKEDERGKRYYDRYRHRLMFPIWDDRGSVIAFGGRAMEGGETGTPEAKYINSPEGRLFSKSRTLYAWHLAKDAVRKQQRLIVTEGYMDTIALHAAGFTYTVATLGTSLTQENVHRLSRAGAKTLFLCFDDDSAGMKAALRAGAMLFDSSDIVVRVVCLPERRDPDTFIAEFGSDAFEEALSNAPTLTRHRINQVVGDEQAWRSKNRVEQLDSLKEVAQALADIDDELVSNEYIVSVANSLSLFTSGWDATRLEESIRTQVQAARKQNKQERRNQQRREQERAAVQARLREGSSEVIPLRRDDSAPPEPDGKYLQAESEASANGSGEVLAFTPGFKRKSEWKPGGGTWQGKGDWKRREEPTHNSIEGAVPMNEAGGTDTVAARLLANVATGDESGVVKAERALLTAMLNAPSLRVSLRERIAPALWTREVHFEIAAYLKALPEEEPVDPPRLFEELSPEAGTLVGDLLLSKTMESMEPKVLEDYIRRIQAHHARQREHENLQILLGKMQRGEFVEPDEKARFEDSARETKRMLPPEK